MRGWGAVLACTLAGCAGTTGRALNLDTPFLRVSYFRFDDVRVKRYPDDPEGEPRRVGATLWIVYSKSWARKYGLDVREPYAKAFPRAEVVAQQTGGRKTGVLIAKGVVPDGEMRRHVREILKRGLAELPAADAEVLSPQYARKMYRDLQQGRFYRILSITTDGGTRTVALASLLEDERLARKFVAAEVYGAAFVSRSAIAVGVGVGGGSR